MHVMQWNWHGQDLEINLGDIREVHKERRILRPRSLLQFWMVCGKVLSFDHDNFCSKWRKLQPKKSSLS
jgi:hypothetical protein